MRQILAADINGQWAVLLTGILLGLAGCTGTGPEDNGQTPPPSVELEVEGDLRTRIESIQDDMPRSGTDGFANASAEALTEWRSLIGMLIDGDTTGARSAIAEHFPSYALIEFTDTETDQVYYVLQESPSVERGWGTVAINPSADRELAVEVPHPVFDLETHVQGADLFRTTGARVLILAGTHRCANQATSPCDGTTSVCGRTGPYRKSDMAHFVAAPFQVAHEVYADRFPELTALSLHGNGREACETVFLSSGVPDDTPESVSNLQQALAQRGVAAGMPGTSACPLVGSTNVQGRYTNGADSPCGTEADSASGRFIHVEQKLDFRQSPDRYQSLIEAVKETL